MHGGAASSRNRSDSGGTAPNAVPETATLTAEARSRDKAKLEGLRAQIVNLATAVGLEYPGGKVECELREEFGSYKLEASHPVVRRVAAAIERAGLKPELIASGRRTANVVIYWNRSSR